MRSLFRVSVIILFFIILAIWSPWNAWDLNISRFFGYANQTENSGIQVKSLSGELKIFVDDKEMGTTNAEQDPFAVSNISPGQHKVRLVKSSNPEGFYAEFNRIINLEPGVDAVISYDLGPSEDFSEGHVLAARSKRSSGLPTLRANTEPASAVILLNDVALTDGEFKDLDLSKQHNIKVSAPGYEKLEFVILPDAQGDRDKLKNYDLELSIRLSLIPLEIN